MPALLSAGGGGDGNGSKNFVNCLQNPKSWRLFRSGPLRGFPYFGLDPPLKNRPALGAIGPDRGP